MNFHVLALTDICIVILCVNFPKAIFYLMYLKIPGGNKDVWTEGAALTSPGKAGNFAHFYGFFLNFCDPTMLSLKPGRAGHFLSLRNKFWVMWKKICAGGDGTAGKSTWEIFIWAEFIRSQLISTMTHEWGKEFLSSFYAADPRICTRGEQAADMREN